MSQEQDQYIRDRIYFDLDALPEDLQAILRKMGAKNGRNPIAMLGSPAPSIWLHESIQSRRRQLHRSPTSHEQTISGQFMYFAAENERDHPLRTLNLERLSAMTAEMGLHTFNWINCDFDKIESLVTDRTRNRSLQFRNCRIAYYINGSQDFHEAGVELTECDIGILNSSHSGSIYLMNNRIEYLSLAENKQTLKNVRCGLLHNSDPDNTKHSFSNVTLKYHPGLIAGFFRIENEGAPKWAPWIRFQFWPPWKWPYRPFARLRAQLARPVERNRRIREIKDLSLIYEENQAEIQATYKALAEYKILTSQRTAIEQYYHYFKSRNSWVSRLLFWFNGAYYNVVVPGVFLIGSALGIETLIRSLDMGPSETPPLAYTFLLPKLLTDILLKDFHWNLWNISWTKLGIVFLEMVFYYSLFSFGLAIKRRWGFTKIQ